MWPLRVRAADGLRRKSTPLRRRGGRQGVRGRTGGIARPHHSRGCPVRSTPGWEASSLGARESGGTGRRAGFRTRCPKGLGGSSPPSRTPSELHKRKGPRESFPSRPLHSPNIPGRHRRNRRGHATGGPGGSRAACRLRPKPTFQLASGGTNAWAGRSLPGRRAAPGTARRSRVYCRGREPRAHELGIDREVAMKRKGDEARS
jgi:hypothetical protein